MIIKCIEGFTRKLGKLQGYYELPVRDVPLEDGGNLMQTAWEPTPEELAAIVDGSPIIVSIIGTAHPPILLGVGPRPKED